MKNSTKATRWLLSMSIVSVCSCDTPKGVATPTSQPTLGYRSAKLLTINGLQFKDLNQNQKLDLYEDWRLPVETRVQDLIQQMTLPEKIGFMLISTTRLENDWTFQPNPPKEKLPVTSGFNEEDLVQSMNMFSKKPLPYPMLSASGTTKGVKEKHLRHFIARVNTSTQIMAEWSNHLQALCESDRLGIPAIVASNPRNHITVDASVGLSVGTTVFSKWPGELGLAAMRDLPLTREFASIAGQEWASVGLRKGYMYMADLATEPRWQRVEGTFGEDADLAAQMIREIVLGFQGNKLNKNSVALTTKHFPGGGPQVEGHDPHFVWGQDQHYPGKRFDYHLKPFQAAIDAGTSAIMPYYAKPIGTQYEPLAFAYNKAIIKDLLRTKMGFKGIINSDTGPIEMMPWGVEKLSILERYQKALDCGVDIFSGSADPSHLMETVAKGLVSEARINESIARLLREKFELGLFENPYVDVEKAVQTVGKADFQKKGDLAMRKSIVLLRNDAQLLPLKAKTKIYFESYYDNGRTKNPVNVLKPAAEKYPNLEFVDSKEAADVVLLWLTPNGGSLFNTKEGEAIELQLSKNKIDVKRVNDVMSSKPTIVAINYTSPWVIDEIEAKNLKTVLATFGTTPDAILDIVTGAFKPSGKMPFSTPVSKKAVLENQSDVPGHLKPKEYALFRFGDGLSY
jgi:beta-glucosidase